MRNVMKRGLLLGIGTVFMSALVTVQANAAALTAGSFVNFPGPGTTDGGPTGASLASQTQPFFSNAANATFTGTLTSTVYPTDATNPYGGLTFTFQVAN